MMDYCIKHNILSLIYSDKHLQYSKVSGVNNNVHYMAFAGEKHQMSNNDKISKFDH